MSEAPSPTTTPLTSEAPAPEAQAPGPEGGSPLGVQPEGEAKPAVEGEAKPAPEPEAKAPEKYEFKLPDGVEAKPEVLAKFEEVAKTHNLSQESAQGLVDLHIAEMNSQAEAFQAKIQEGWDKTISEWKTGVEKAFPGEKLKEAQTEIGRAIDEYGSPEARQAFDMTGAGWNPAILSMIHKMAVALSEGKPLPGGAPVQQKGKTLGEIFYGAPT